MSVCVHIASSLHVPSVIADWEGISIACSFKDWMYLIWSITGISTLRPYEGVRKGRCGVWWHDVGVVAW